MTTSVVFISKPLTEETKHNRPRMRSGPQGSLMVTESLNMPCIGNAQFAAAVFEQQVPLDGIVGQGLPVLVLVTTNEPVRRLHPAVARPGRCAARVEFEPFSADEAAAWLDERGGEHRTPGSATLAQLFAHLHGHELEDEKQVGFAQ